MNTAPITAAPSEFGGLPPLAPPSAPAAPSFSDMLASATSSLAAFALLPTSGASALTSADAPPAAPKKDPNTDSAAVPIALPAPVQTPPPTASDDSTTAATQSASTGAGSPPTQQGSTASTSASTGTGGTSNGSAQSTGGTALPPMAQELNARIALGAQALLSQPSQVLTTVPHGALEAAATSGVVAGAHGTATSDPAAILPKVAANATLAAAAPNGAAPTLETALQTAAQSAATPAASAAGEAAVLATASDTNTQSDPVLATPAPAAVPLPVTDAAPSMDAALPSAIASSALDQVAASLRQIGSKLGLSQIEIQLKPASLGAVDVKLELTHDGRVAAVISADRSDTLMQLQRGSGELQLALRDAGLQTDSGSLSFNLRGDAQTSDQGSRQPSYAAQTSASNSSSDDLLAVPAGIAGLGQSSHNGLLNIQV